MPEANHWKRQYRRLLLREKNRSDTLALLSHRIRTPLTSIKWYVELLLDETFGSLTIAQLEFLDKMQAGITDAVKVLDRFLEVSRIEHGSPSMGTVTIDVSQSLDNVVQSLSKQIREKKHNVAFQLKRKRATVNCNPLLFHTIMEVLLSNAIVYTPARGRINLSVERGKPGTVVIRVSDSGIGIPASERRRLFSKFFRGERAKRVHTTGNGLGLYLVKRILKDIGGTIRCDRDKEAPGASFVVVMPGKA